MKKDISKRTSYIVVGISLLVIAIIGATFAYFTATADNNNTITGDMANIRLNLSVVKKTNVDELKGGLIPMTNAMIHNAVTSSHGICVDDNGNAVCQIYKITINNTGSASMFVDGYVNLTGGSGISEDYPSTDTTMRWSQVFCSETSGTLSACTTAGSPTVRQSNSISWNQLGTGTGHDLTEIKDTYNSVKTTGTIQGNGYDVINTNYIRTSKHTGNSYTRENDVTSALVFNQYLNSNDNDSSNDTGDSSSTYTDSQVYYVAVWLSENGHNQTAGAPNAAQNVDDFFQGTVIFNSSEGSEVTATFSGYNRPGSNNNESQTFTGTKYTVNIYDENAEDNSLVWLDNPIPSGVTLYDTPAAARAAFSNRPFYLKHTIVNDIVTESYVEFVVTPEMVSEEAGMTAGTYTLRGLDTWDVASDQCKSQYYDSVNDLCLSPYYAANVATLKQAFGENSGYCSDFTSSSGVNCYVSGLGADAYSRGYMYAYDDSVHCGVGPDGSSDCGSW